MTATLLSNRDGQPVTSAAERRLTSASAPRALSWSPLLVPSGPPDMDTARLPSRNAAIGMACLCLIQYHEAQFGVVRYGLCDKNHSARLITRRRAVAQDWLWAAHAWWRHLPR